MSVCLVTGGAGFIGSHLVDALVAAGHVVRVLDNFSTGTMSNLGQVHDRIEIIRGDVTDTGLVCEAIKGVELVFHQAALVSVPRSVADPLATHQVCATGTLQVLMAAQGAQVRRVIYAASSSAYGNANKLPLREADAPQPHSPYAVAKLTGEQYCSAFTHVYGLETVRLRYFNVFGPRQSPAGPYSAVIPIFIEAMAAGRSPLIHGDGLQSRDFTHVDDIVQANLLAAEVPRVAGKIYNIASGRRTSVLDLATKINEILGTQIKPLHDKPRPGDIRHSQADISLAQAELGFCPCTDMKNDLARCIDFFAGRRDGPTRATGATPAPLGPKLTGKRELQPAS